MKNEIKIYSIFYGGCVFYCVVGLKFAAGTLRERFREGGGVGRGDHHAARSRQYDFLVGHDSQHGRILRLDWPDEEEAGEFVD